MKIIPKLVILILIILLIYTTYLIYLNTILTNQGELSGQTIMTNPVYNELFLNKRPTYYIFWTGGYDSTFRILQALIVDKSNIVPIYLSGIIDNGPSNKTRRKNNKQELAALRNITSEIYKRYPHLRKMLKPLVIIPEVKLDRTVSDSMEILYRRGMVRRPICQYGALSQVSLDMNRPIEMAVEKEPHSSMMYKTVHSRVTGEGIDRKISDKVINREPEFNIYRNFRFSTLHLSKKDMLREAKKYGFDDLLRKTWSCWYPHNGKPCNRCIMCKERIV